MVDRDWSNASDLEKAQYFASIGAHDMVLSVLKVSKEVSDAEKRRLVSQALNFQADFREQQTSQGVYSSMEFDNPEAALALANLAQVERTRATEILYPENGESVEQHYTRLTKTKLKLF